MSWASVKKPVSVAVAVATLIAAFAIGWAVKPDLSSASMLKPVAATSSYQLPKFGGLLRGDGPPGAGAAAASSEPTQQAYQQWVAAVAARAGIDASTLDNAIRSVAEDRIAAAAQAGKISQARAATIENASKNGTLGTLIQHRIRALQAQGKHPIAMWFHRRIAQILHNLHSGH